MENFTSRFNGMFVVYVDLGHGDLANFALYVDHHSQCGGDSQVCGNFSRVFNVPGSEGFLFLINMYLSYAITKPESSRDNWYSYMNF